MPYKTNDEPKDKYTDRKPLQECRRILHADEEGYTDEEVLLIRDFLITIIELDYSQFQKRKEKKSLIVQLKSESDAQSNNIHPGEHRRAS